MALDFAVPAMMVIGTLYTVGGVVGTRAGLQARLLDSALSKISLKPPKTSETLRALWLVLAGLVILAGGVALLLRLEIAAHLFVVSALAQAAYLGIIAPRYLDIDDPVDAAGRRQTVRAFGLYLISTAFVVWAFSTGHLHSVASLPMPLPIVVAAVVGGYGVYALWNFARPLANR